MTSERNWDAVRLIMRTDNPLPDNPLYPEDGKKE